MRGPITFFAREQWHVLSDVFFYIRTDFFNVLVYFDGCREAGTVGGNIKDLTR